MANLTPRQIGMAAWNAGFKDEATLARAIAVALAESSGNPKAHNGNAKTGDNSYGLWQINMIGSMGPARRRQFDIANNEALFDPQKNADAAWLVSNKGKNWVPWSVFKNGTYTKHMAVTTPVAKELVETAKKNMPSNPLDYLFGDIGDAIGDVKDNITGALDIGGAITAAFNALGQNFFKMGMNVVGVTIAAILLILGIIILLRSPIAKGAKAVVNVAGPGKVAKVAGKVGKVL